MYSQPYKTWNKRFSSPYNNGVRPNGDLIVEAANLKNYLIPPVRVTRKVAVLKSFNSKTEC